MKKTKVILTLVCAVLLVAASVMGTLAYLTAKTNVVTNKFTVGKVGFNEQMNGGLDEALTDEYGNPGKMVTDPNDAEKKIFQKVEDKKDADRVTGNTYKLVPNATYTKDPTVYVAADSEDAWLVVKISNGIKDIEAATTIHDQMTSGEAAKWIVLDADNGIYGYKTKVSAKAEITIFETFTVASNADVSKYANAQITIQAGLIQAEGFTSVNLAWNANTGLFTAK